MSGWFVPADFEKYEREIKANPLPAPDVVDEVDEGFNQAFDFVRQQQLADSFRRGMVEEYDRYDDEVFAKTGQRLGNPFRVFLTEQDQLSANSLHDGGNLSPSTPMKDWAYGEFASKLAKLKQQHPDLPDFNDEAAFARLQTKWQTGRAADENLRTTGFGSFGYMAGLVTANLTDPTVWPFLGMGASGLANRGAQLTLNQVIQSAGRVAKTEALIGGAGAMMQSAPIYIGQKATGNDNAGSEALTNIAAGTVLSGLFGGTFEGLKGTYFKWKAARGLKPDQRVGELIGQSDIPREELIAADLIEQELHNIEQANLFDGVGADQIHNRKLAAASKKLNDPDAPELDHDPHPFPSDPDKSAMISIDPRIINVDAERFQFKSDGDQFGVTARLKGVQQWEPHFADPLLVWQDLNGQLFVADGHQRLGLAKRLQAQGQDIKVNALVLRAKDQVSDMQAMMLASAKNIAQGSGSPIDAAKIFRTLAKRPEIEQSLPNLAQVLPVNSVLVKQARALARLDEDAFTMVKNELVPVEWGVMAAEAVDDPAKQIEILQTLQKLGPVSPTQAQTMVRDIVEIGFSEGEQFDLFGKLNTAASLLPERSKILEASLSRMRRDRATFNNLLNRQGTIEAAGNKLDAGTNEKIVKSSEERLAQVQALATRKGALSDALTRAALARKKDGLSTTRAVDQFLADLDELDKRGELLGDGQPVADVPDVSSIKKLERSEIEENRARFRAGGGEIGPFGPIHSDLSGQWTKAIQRLMNDQDGEVPALLRHPDVGEIDVVWGNNPREGLNKIAVKHPDVINSLPDILAKMNVRERLESQVVLESPDHKAVVVLNYHRQPKTWLLTAYRKVGKQTLNPTDVRQDGLNGRADTAPPTEGAVQTITPNSPKSQFGAKAGSAAEIFDDIDQSRFDAVMNEAEALLAENPDLSITGVGGRIDENGRFVGDQTSALDDLERLKLEKESLDHIQTCVIGGKK